MTLIDFSIANAGEIGKNRSWWFSDLYRAAVSGEFTGGILVSNGPDRAIFFDGGRPVHASGPGYSGHYLGEILLRDGQVAQSHVSNAVQRQQSESPRPLLGAVLVHEANLDPATVKRAMQTQTRARLLELFALPEGTWRSAPGKDARIFQIGVPIDPWPVLLQGLIHASDRELRAASDLMLGRAVKLAKDTSKLEGFALDDTARKVLKYLDKPRKPDQLERAVGNRKLVRAILRLLAMEDALQLEPIARAIPIPKATLLKGGLPVSSLAYESPAPPQVEAKPAPPKARAASRAEPLPIVKEVREFHASMKKKNHFELFDLRVSSAIDSTLLRKNFTILAKKFHPDAFPSELPDDVKTMTREVSAFLNEAYNTISDDKRRAEYSALLADDRIKGDARKAELIRDAETKSKMGAVMLKKRDFQKAREFFKFAVEADPSSGTYKANLAWAMFSDPDFDKEKALAKGYELIVDALGTKSLDAQSHYIVGQILKARGNAKEAEHHFREAIRLDRKHADAQRELRLIDMRADKKAKRDDKGKSAFSKLFKRD